MSRSPPKRCPAKFLLVPLLLLAACGQPLVGARGECAGALCLDAGDDSDAGGAGEDGGGSDAGSSDGGSPDAGGSDGGSPDGGSSDGGGSDAGSSDGGGSDAGSSDGGGSDAGGPDAGTCPQGTRPCAVTESCLPNAECCTSAECVGGPGGCYQAQGVCGPGAGGARACSWPPKPSGTTCASDLDVCTDDVCDGDGGCAHLFNTAPCSDGRACTGSDRCQLGQCVGTPSCGAPPSECYQAGVCHADGGCGYAPKPSGDPCTDDGNPCTYDRCNGSGTCAHTAKPLGTPCADGLSCTVSDECQYLTCDGIDICAGGMTCTSTGCKCPLGQLWCEGRGRCESPTSACADVACGLCGHDSACDGYGVSDSVTGYSGTCATALGSCSATNSQSSQSDAFYYRAPSDPSAFFWVCAKVARSPWTASAYQWARRVPSAGLPGAGPNGCQEGGFYATCDLLCLDKLSYRAYCDGAAWNSNLSSSAGQGCPDYSTLTPALDCP